MADRWEDRTRIDRDDRGYRNYQERDRDRGLIERAGDEVRSWMGDDEAQRRRRMDEMRDDRQDRDWTDRTANSAERAWDRGRETVRDVTDRDRDGRRGWAEFTDNDRPWDRSRGYGAGATSYGRNDYWNRERGAAGETSRYNYSGPSMTPAAGYQNWNSGTETRRDWDRQNFVGRGPRGYKRSDERIREDVCDRLTDDPRIDAEDIDVRVADAEVTLSGSVRSRDEKRFAEDLIERITGVREVNNNLKVRRTDEVLGTARSGSSVLGLNETPPPQPTQQTPTRNK